MTAGDLGLRTVRLLLLAFLLVLSPARDAFATDPPEREVERLVEASVSLLKERALRLARVAERIRVHGAELCPVQSPVLGVVFLSRKEIYFGDPNAITLLPWDARARIFAVVEDLPAQRAGLEEGDVVVRIDGKRVGDPEDVRGLRVDSVRSDFEIEFERERARRVVTVEHVPGCEEAPSLCLHDRVNAWASYHRTLVTTAMMRFVRSDDELANVVGHELAHNVLQHRGARRHEEEADYLGSYFAARAGYDPGRAIDFWKRYATRDLAGMLHHAKRSHPTYPARIQALEAALREIREKQERGEPLMPRVQE
jgi:hypothetical protein